MKNTQHYSCFFSIPCRTTTERKKETKSSEKRVHHTVRFNVDDDDDDDEDDYEEVRVKRDEVRASPMSKKRSSSLDSKNRSANSTPAKR